MTTSAQTKTRPGAWHFQSIGWSIAQWLEDIMHTVTGPVIAHCLYGAGVHQIISCQRFTDLQLQHCFDAQVLHWITCVAKGTVWPVWPLCPCALGCSHCSSILRTLLTLQPGAPCNIQPACACNRRGPNPGWLKTSLQVLSKTDHQIVWNPKVNLWSTSGIALAELEKPNLSGSEA